MKNTVSSVPKKFFLLKKALLTQIIFDPLFRKNKLPLFPAYRSEQQKKTKIKKSNTNV